MTLRIVKILLVLGVAFFYTLVVFNNLTDYESNYFFVQHTLSMDTTFPGNHGMWRALHSPALVTAFYCTIIGWEIAVMVLCWWGGLSMTRAIHASSALFNRSKRVSIAGLGLSLLQWLIAFLSVGGEWFLFWQSKTWNGQDAAFRMFTVVGIVLLLVAQPDTEGQP
jgi:predicted small integral membrane protein